MNFFSRLTETMHLMFQRPTREQFAALCWRRAGDGIEVLLLTSRDTGRWVIPKGWPMPGKTGCQVAEQEAFEEAGMRGRVEPDLLGHFTYDKVLEGGLPVPCRVQVHALEVGHCEKRFKEKGQRELAWFSPAEAAERVNEPGLKRLILSLQDRLAR